MQFTIFKNINTFVHFTVQNHYNMNTDVYKRESIEYPKTQAFHSIEKNDTVTYYRHNIL